MLFQGDANSESAESEYERVSTYLSIVLFLPIGTVSSKRTDCKISISDVALCGCRMSPIRMMVCKCDDVNVAKARTISCPTNIPDKVRVRKLVARDSNPLLVSFSVSIHTNDYYECTRLCFERKELTPYTPKCYFEMSEGGT